MLILDEPTSMLTPEGVAELQKVLVRLKGAGQAVIFITHKLHEAASIGDRVTILKGGRVVGSLGEDVLRSRTPEELQAEIVKIMFGEEAGDRRRGSPSSRRPCPSTGGRRARPATRCSSSPA